MKWLEILDRIGAGEDETTEFKRGVNDLSAIGRAVCSFANTAGGVVVLGVTNSQEIVGVAGNAESVQERLTSFLQNGCNAPVSASLGRHEDPSGWVYWVQVPRQRGFEPLRCNGRVWVRRGRSSVEPSPTELQELYNAFGYILTEERTIQAAAVSQIDLEVFYAYLGRLGLDTEDDLQPESRHDLLNRGVISEIEGEFYPTLYGTMAFGSQPQKYPQTENFHIQCVSYDGQDRAADVLLVGDSNGRLDDQVRRALGWVASLGHREAYRGFVREDQALLPVLALRESLVNAVVHRDYAITGSKVLLEVFGDHVDITSPGTLPNHMSADSVKAGGLPRSRNELMAHYMLTMGFMEQRGRGWPIMRRAMREFNDTEPEIIHDERSKFVRVTFRLSSY